MAEYALEVVDLEPTGKGWYLWEDSPRWADAWSADTWVDEIWQGPRKDKWPAHVQGMRLVCRDSDQDEWQAVGTRG